MKCLVCDKDLPVVKSQFDGTQVKGGLWLHLDIDEGSRYSLPTIFEQEGLSAFDFLTKLVTARTITAMLCDDCFKARHDRCFGTKLEMKRTYHRFYPDGHEEVTTT